MNTKKNQQLKNKKYSSAKLYFPTSSAKRS